jgi:septal ring-binding cell division protein DamX
MRASFEEEGDLRGVDLLAGLVSIWRNGESGALHFSRPGATARFDILEAEIVGVVTSDLRYETAAILVRAGKLSEEALERVAPPEGSDRALACLQAGILTRREWRWGEKIRAIEVLSDLLTWLEGSYVFDRSIRPGPGDFRLTIPRLVLELFLRSRDRTLIHHHLGQADAPLLRAEGFEQEFSSFGLTADAESVVRLIDGKASAEEICARAPADSFAVEKLLAALVTLGLVRPTHAPSEAAGAGTLEEEPPPPEAEIGPEPDQPIELREPEEWKAPAEASLPEEPAPEAPSPVWPDLAEAPLSEPEGEEPVAAWEPGPPEPLDRTLEMPSSIEPERRNRSLGPLLLLLAVLAATVAVVLYLRSRRGEAVRALPPEPAPAATSAPALDPTIPAFAPAPTVVETAAASPTALSRPTPAATRAPTAVPGSGERQEWVLRAEREQKRLRSDRRTRFAIQLELVCETESVKDAFRYDRPAGTMWLLPASHAERTCFRVLWGRYPTLEAARRAKARIPAFFTTPRNRPAVVGVRESLLR